MKDMMQVPRYLLKLHFEVTRPSGDGVSNSVPLSSDEGTSLSIPPCKGASALKSIEAGSFYVGRERERERVSNYSTNVSGGAITRLVTNSP
ncbi:hypothetical protein TNCV_3806621 [Trichonephila clavipes]|nr:hypothetical protein TNCV_3806621 [Trichonephila clavipes]